ncbi:hypothetical protein LXA43DRAFT_1068179 [Ganoderma leucocontextum]|nr:hypothetical protein LXA43DRAFT_1068179 [Ganoderma leucocontextum]
MSTVDGEANHSQSPGVESHISRHSQYYFEDGNLHFLVENVLFNVHRSVFAATSTLFQERVPSSMWSGRSQHHPVHLKDVRSEDFAKFLSLIYPSSTVESFDAKDWLSVLEQSRAWGCDRISAVAVAELQNFTLADAVKIAAWKEFGLDETELAPCYHALGARINPITLDEGRILGLDMTVQLAAWRDKVNYGVLSYFKDTVGGINIDHGISVEHVRDLVCRVLLADFMKE